MSDRQKTVLKVAATVAVTAAVIGIGKNAVDTYMDITEINPLMDTADKIALTMEIGRDSVATSLHNMNRKIPVDTPIRSKPKMLPDVEYRAYKRADQAIRAQEKVVERAKKAAMTVNDPMKRDWSQFDDEKNRLLELYDRRRRIKNRL